VSPLIQEWQVLAGLLGFFVGLPIGWAVHVALRALKRSAARKRSVLGRRVPLPEWRARRNWRNEWIVERRR
jgi:hypothetical protein